MIRTLQINGFKSILSETMALGRVNCFIGANGVGKSNVLEAIGVLAAAAHGWVDEKPLLRRGVRASLPRLYKSSFASERSPADIGVGAEGDAGAAYRVSLSYPLHDYGLPWKYKAEWLTDGVQDRVSYDVPQAKNPSCGLAASRGAELGPDNAAAQLMRRLQDYAIYCPNTPTLRGMVPDPQARAPVGLNGGQLAEGFAELRKQFANDASGIWDSVWALLDWVADVRATRHGSALMSCDVPQPEWMLKFTDRYMLPSRNELMAYDASEGALYVIFYAALCLLAQSPKFLAIDNLAQALAPRLATQLTANLSRWLRHGGSDRQLLFTTHNPAVLDGLDLSDPEVRLFSVERNSKNATCVRRVVLTPSLAEMHQTYPLSSLWLMGHLAAQPHAAPNPPNCQPNSSDPATHERKPVHQTVAN